MFRIEYKIYRVYPYRNNKIIIVLGGRSFKFILMDISETEVEPIVFETDVFKKSPKLDLISCTEQEEYFYCRTFVSNKGIIDFMIPKNKKIVQNKSLGFTIFNFDCDPLSDFGSVSHIGSSVL